MSELRDPVVSADQAWGISIVGGHPTAEEIAALTAVISALGTGDSLATATDSTASRGGRLRRRRELTGNALPWKVGRP